MHLASFPLPEQRDDFGGNVTSDDALVRRVRHAVRVRTRVGRPAAVLGGGRPARRRADVLAQAVATAAARASSAASCSSPPTGGAFCLYVVAGSRASLPRIIGTVNDALAALQIERAGP